MEAIATDIPDVKVFVPKKHGDHRGFFAETYNQRSFAEAGVDLVFVQDNQSYSVEPGVLRGLHFQSAPCAQDKLVRVLRGRVLDVAVDIRRSSPTFGQHVKVELTPEKFNQILVPKGFAHGILTLDPHTELLYKVTDFYSPENDYGILWNDPDLGIDWSIDENEVILSDKDRTQPRLNDAPVLFD